MTSELNIALHALLILEDRKHVVTSNELSEGIRTNPARVRKVLSKLRENSIIESIGGMAGGYKLKKDISKLTLKEIAEITNTEIVTTSWFSGDINTNCVISSNMGKVMKNIYKELDKVIKKEMEKITVDRVREELLLSLDNKVNSLECKCEKGGYCTNCDTCKNKM